ncbi:unnamed protein product [Pleuronectes platessa]|uniref:Uncharacterized protein n=1 Tax=Pleuronectes platessa TaxID=8262 RepID=A0A9N7Y8E2_PLEPL|nr:unnamed protein product [Pleuronectes platessa]
MVPQRRKLPTLASRHRLLKRFVRVIKNNIQKLLGATLSAHRRYKNLPFLIKWGLWKSLKSDKSDTRLRQGKKRNGRDESSAAAIAPPPKLKRVCRNGRHLMPFPERLETSIVHWPCFCQAKAQPDRPTRLLT